MFVNNLELFGHLIDSDDFDTSLTHPELYEIFYNRLVRHFYTVCSTFRALSTLKDWEEKYLHKDYRKSLSPEYQVEQPCPDVYWYPQFSPVFCNHLIEIMETNGNWSAGKNEVS